jgi:hypothetical protein
VQIVQCKSTLYGCTIILSYRALDNFSLPWNTLPHNHLAKSCVGIERMCLFSSTYIYILPDMPEMRAWPWNPCYKIIPAKT